MLPISNSGRPYLEHCRGALADFYAAGVRRVGFVSAATMADPAMASRTGLFATSGTRIVAAVDDGRRGDDGEGSGGRDGRSIEGLDGRGAEGGAESDGRGARVGGESGGRGVGGGAEAMVR